MWRPYFGEVSSLNNSLPINGFVDTKFALAKDAFVRNFTHLEEIGASLCVVVEGKVVVDLSGGWKDTQRIQPWMPSTLVNSFSVGKGILSILLAHALSSSTSSVNDTVASVWPELLRSRIGHLTIGDLCAHRAGLPALSNPLLEQHLYDWPHMIESLVQQDPWWEPGTAHGYHVNTFGFLVGELVCRIRNDTPEQLLRPLRNSVGNEMFWGVPQDRLDDIATLVWHDADQQREKLESLSETSMHVLAYNNPANFSGLGAVNTPAWRQSVHPSTNLHTTARAVALAYESVRSNTLGIHPAVLKQATSTVSRGADVVLGAETHFGVGFQLPTATRRFGPHDESFGHYGAGGAMGFCDPVSQVCVGYVMNQMGRGWQNSRNQALIDSIFTCL
jgi:CubicO group peptidase (beta-lactamase class C family)